MILGAGTALGCRLAAVGETHLPIAAEGRKPMAVLCFLYKMFFTSTTTLHAEFGLAGEEEELCAKVKEVFLWP